MLKKLFLVIISCVLLSRLMVSCSEDNTPSVDKGQNLHLLYTELSAIPTYSIFEKANSRTPKYGLPTFTQSDLEYLSSLSQPEFEDFRNYTLKELENYSEEAIDNLITSNVTRIYSVLGSEDMFNIYRFF